MIKFKDVTEKVKAVLSDLVKDYETEMERAYLKVDSAEKFTVNFTVSMKPESGEVEVVGTISFIESKVKDSITVKVTDQQNLPGMEAVNKFKKDLGKSGMELKGATKDKNGTPTIHIETKKGK